MNLPLLQPMPIAGVSKRIESMLNALKAQRDATADEVVNLCGELSEAREKITAQEARVKELEEPK
mgnify:CR=1 FL=1